MAPEATRREVGEQATEAPHVLREYAVLADGERGAVVGPRGDVCWLCFPRFDSPAVFSSLIGGDGVFAVWPAGRNVWGGYYEQGTLLWHSRWVNSDGSIMESRESLGSPGDARHMTLLRHLAASQGPARFHVVLHPRADYDARPFGSWTRHDDGSWTASSGDLRLRLSGLAQAKVVPDGRRGHRLEGQLELSEGERHDLVLELALDELPEPPHPHAMWQATSTWWEESKASCDELAVGHRDASQAVAVLHGLTSAHGGMVAALTTSLPERADTGHSYDYRYAWIRDQCFAAQALAALGRSLDLHDRLVGFVADRLLADGDTMAPAYTSLGQPIPGQRSLDLPGYPGGNDIVGNHVCQQFQLDAFGEALCTLAAAARLDRLDAEGWRAAEVAVEAIAARWQQPDTGIWELGPAFWTHSRLICVAGLRAICATGAPSSKVASWTSLADAVLAETSSRCLHPSGRWQRTSDDQRVDAALLLPSVRGALHPNDPRVLATLEAVRRELTVDGYVHRYRVDERPLGVAEGAFLFCGFVMSMATRQQGWNLESARWFERNRAACGPAGLLSEEFDVHQRQLRGNLPQAFVHATMIEAATLQGGDPSEPSVAPF